MNRRGFLGILTGLLSTAVIDPEKLLWVPGQKKIFIPKPRSISYGFVQIYGSCVLPNQTIVGLWKRPSGEIDKVLVEESKPFGIGSLISTEDQSVYRYVKFIGDVRRGSLVRYIDPFTVEVATDVNDIGGISLTDHLEQ